MIYMIDTNKDEITGAIDLIEPEEQILEIKLMSSLLLCSRAYYSQVDKIPTWDDLIKWYTSKYDSIKSVRKYYTEEK